MIKWLLCSIGLMALLVFGVSCGDREHQGEVLTASIGGRDAKTDESLFLKINEEIFSKSCAYVECHGGTFEPNLSSITSAYYSLVYHPVVKNSKDGRFQYRVNPYNVESSVLYERLTNCCFVNQGDQMPGYGEPLTEAETQLIYKWIGAGAPDQYGNLPEKPENYSEVHTQPVDVITPGNAFTLFATNSNFTVFYDSMRVEGNYNKAFRVPVGAPSVTFLLISGFGNRIQKEFSQNPPVIAITNAKGKDLGRYATMFVDFRGNATYTATIPTDRLPAGEPIYIHYFKDGHKADWKFPDASSQTFFRDNWSFFIDEAL